ncbi:MAG: cytochrome c3 family protein [Deltaproteobacteria bacterium]
MRKWVKILPFVLLAVVAPLGFYFYPKAESSPKGPQQPIVFSHKIHATENQIPCQYCHSYVGKAELPGIPSMQKCMGCHTQVAGQDVDYEYEGGKINIKQEIQKLRDYWDKKTPIAWTKVHYLPEHVHFNHKRHIKRGFECKTCHGEVEKMDVVHRVNKLEMGWCIGCHTENAKNEQELTQLRDCLTCHY